MTIITRNASIYGVTQSIGDTAIAYALTAARWGVLGADWYTGAFFSPAAYRRYQDIGQCIGFAAVVAVALGMSARIHLQHWADGEVDDALTAPVAEMQELLLQAFEPLTVTPAAKPTLAQLRKQCIAHNKELPAGDSRRIARAARLTKSQAIAALRGIG